VPLTINQISKLDFPKKIVFFTDDDWQFYPISRHFARSFDWIITTYPDRLPLYSQHGYDNIILSQYGCNQNVFGNLKLAKVYDVTFIGAPHGNRTDLIRFLIAKGIDIKVFGAGWKRYPDLVGKWGGYLSDAKMARIICKTRINLNPSRSYDDRSIQLKGRTFEIAGCGGFQLTEHQPDLYKFYNRGTEIVTYTSNGQLLDLIQYFLKHEEEREAIARNAYARTMADHTWEKRLHDILESIENNKQSRHSVKRHISTVGVVLLPGTVHQIRAETVYSLNSQTYRNLVAFVPEDAVLITPLDFPVYRFKQLFEITDALAFDYVTAISNGEIWEPEKIEAQTRSLDFDTKEGINVNLASWSLMLSGRSDEIRYSYRMINENVKDTPHYYLIIPSSVMLISAEFKQYLKEIEVFFKNLLMSDNLQDLLRISSGNFRIVEPGYSQINIPYHQICTAIRDFPHDKHFGWIWTPRLFQTFRNLIIRGNIFIAFTALLSRFFPRFAWQLLLSRCGIYAKS